MGSLLTFFSLTYALAWTVFIAAGALSGSVSPAAPTAILQILVLPGVFAPSIVAIALTAKADGSAGLRALLHPLLQWKVGARWFVFAVGYMAAIKLTVALVHRIATGEWPRFGQTPLYIMLAAIVISTPIQAGEEIGWRGYALPRLAIRFGFARASILLGLIWACWHLPFFFIPGADTYRQSFPVWTLQVTALSVAIAWIYVRTNGSLLLTMLMHSAMNQTWGIVPGALSNAKKPFSLYASLDAWLTAAFLWIAAVYYLVRMHKSALRTSPRGTIL